MKIYCTICCKEQRTDKRLIEANKRYISDRIQKIDHKSKEDKVEFRVLSSKFGLLKPEEKIPYYDHILMMEEISDLSKMVQQQLLSQKIDKVIFFAKNPIKHPYWKPYIALIKSSCKGQMINLEIKYID